MEALSGANSQDNKQDAKANKEIFLRIAQHQSQAQNHGNSLEAKRCFLLKAEQAIGSQCIELVIALSANQHL